MVQRRYRRVLEEGGPFPDLIVIDGGKGQLTAAYEALESLGLANLVAVGLAKREELIFTRDHDEPIALAKSDPALLLLQRIRDEAHRFAMTFHRTARARADDYVGARRHPRGRRSHAQRAASTLRQPRRRAPGHARGTGIGGRGRSSRMRFSASSAPRALTDGRRLSALSYARGSGLVS